MFCLSHFEQNNNRLFFCTFSVLFLYFSVLFCTFLGYYLFSLSRWPAFLKLVGCWSLVTVNSYSIRKVYTCTGLKICCCFVPLCLMSVPSYGSNATVKSRITKKNLNILDKNVHVPTVRPGRNLILDCRIRIRIGFPFFGPASHI